MGGSMKKDLAWSIEAWTNNRGDRNAPVAWLVANLDGLLEAIGSEHPLFEEKDEKIEDLETAVKGLEHDKDRLEIEVGDLEEQIKQLETQIRNLEDKLDEAESTVTVLQHKLRSE